MQGARIATGFQTLVFSPAGLSHPALAIAASRAGGLGVLDLEFETCHVRSVEQLELLAQHAGHNGFAVRLGGFSVELQAALVEQCAHGLSLVALAVEQLEQWAGSVHDLRAAGVRVLLELSSSETPEPALLEAIDGLILKGHEAAGFVGESSCFILAQHWRQHTDLPLYLRGGITPHTAAAAAVAGCAGVVLDLSLIHI